MSLALGHDGFRICAGAWLPIAHCGDAQNANQNDWLLGAVSSTRYSKLLLRHGESVCYLARACTACSAASAPVAASPLRARARNTSFRHGHLLRPTRPRRRPDTHPFLAHLINATANRTLETSDLRYFLGDRRCEHPEWSPRAARGCFLARRSVRGQPGALHVLRSLSTWMLAPSASNNRLELLSEAPEQRAPRAT